MDTKIKLDDEMFKFKNIYKPKEADLFFFRKYSYDSLIQTFKNFKIFYKPNEFNSINFIGNKFTEDNLNIFIDFLQYHENIEELNFDYCNLNDLMFIEILKSINFEKINKLKLSVKNNNINNDGIRYLSNLIKNNYPIKNLELYHNRFSTEMFKCLCESLMKNNYIKKIVVGFNGLKDVEASYIAKIIKYSRSLKELDIHNNQIEYNGYNYIFKSLQSNTSLITLNCSSSIKFDTKNISLRYLDISYNQIIDDGIKHIFDLLKSNNYILNLNICHNNFSSFYIPNLGESLKSNKCLEVLDLSDNNLNQGIKLLLKSLIINNTLKKLDISSINIRHTDLVYLANISNNISLHKLNISCNNIGDSGAIEIAKIITNSCLENLCINYNSISDNGFKFICEALKNNHYLKHFNFGKNLITEKGALEMSKVLKVNNSLKWVNICSDYFNSNNIIVEFRMALENNRSLETLIGIEGAEDLLTPEYLNFKRKKNMIKSSNKTF